MTVEVHCIRVLVCHIDPCTECPLTIHSRFTPIIALDCTNALGVRRHVGFVPGGVGAQRACFVGISM